MKIIHLYRMIGRKISGKKLENVQRLLRYAGVDVEADVWTGFNTFFSMLFSVAIGLIVLAFTLDKLIALFVLIASFVLYHLTVFFFLFTAADSRAKFVSSILPDFLSLMAVNIKSGMSVEMAFMRSDRPEFGPFSQSVRRASRRILAGEPIEAALQELKKDYNCTLLSSIVSTIIEGAQLGGELSSLLEMLAVDIREEQMMKKEIAASILTYAAFIFMAACIAAPVLLSVVTKLATIMSSMSTQIGAEITSIQVGAGHAITMGFKFDVGLLKYFAIATLAIVSSFASLIVGIIREGNEKAGLKYLPIFLFFSMAIFFMARRGLDLVLSGMI